MSKKLSPSGDAAQGVALVAVIFVLALLDGAWLIAVPAAIVLALVIMALS